MIVIRAGRGTSSGRGTKVRGLLLSLQQRKHRWGATGRHAKPLGTRSTILKRRALGAFYGRVVAYFMLSSWRELHPPKVLLDEDIRWVLRSAFADGATCEPRPASPARAVDLIHRFRLLAQVTSRLDAEQLDRALTPALRTTLSDEARWRVMRSLAVTQARECVCEAAEQSGTDIILLKQAALEALKLITPAQRFAADVDVLIDVDRIAELGASLIKQGCVVRPRRNPGYHPVVYRTPADISIEIHTAIPYVRRRPAASFVELEELRRSDWNQTQRLAPFLRVRTPPLDLLSAHLVAHSLAQHRFTPHHHAPLRAVADVCHLGLDQAEALAEAAFGWIEADVARVEYNALLELVRGLRLDRVDSLSAAALRLLDHVIASALNDRYQARLLFQREMQVIRQMGVWSWAKTRAQRVVNPTEEELSWLVRDGSAADRNAARAMTPIVFARRLGRVVSGVFARR